MIIQIAQPVGFSQIGKRSNNEDAIFPLCGDESTENRLFLVCDGMGGHSNGEIASHLTINRFAKYFDTHFQQKRSLEEIEDLWNNALIELEEEFEDYILQNPDSKGMGTTLCLLHFHDKGVTIGHIGDSRVYQISEGQVVFMTEDHSIVNELLKSGEITPAEALTYPNRNVITRAIQGTSVPTIIFLCVPMAFWNK
jgi:serine/threonine protein phosphatase PrpC